jgi:hypothetical protein
MSTLKVIPKIGPIMPLSLLKDDNSSSLFEARFELTEVDGPVDVKNRKQELYDIMHKMLQTKLLIMTPDQDCRNLVLELMDLLDNTVVIPNETFDKLVSYEIKKPNIEVDDILGFAKLKGIVCLEFMTSELEKDSERVFDYCMYTLRKKLISELENNPSKGVKKL